MQKYTTLEYKQNEQKTIGEIILKREKNKNSMNIQFFNELSQLLDHLQTLSNLRVVILSGHGKQFSTGLDLQDAITIMQPSTNTDDIARKGIAIHDQIIVKWQECFNKLEQLKVPVISAIHSYCLGGAVDLILATDIRYCTKDSMFSIKEVDIGLCADLGTTQRLPLITSNLSLMKELVYSARMFGSSEAMQVGLVSRVLDNVQLLRQAVDSMANTIATKSPVAIYTSKKVINYQHHEQVRRGLQYVAALNMNMLQTTDIHQAVQAFFTKQPPLFPKL